MVISAIKNLGSFSLINALVLLAASPGFAQTAPAEGTATGPADTVIAQRSSRDDDNRINYFGVGGTIGVTDDGDTELGDGGFSLVGRFSFTDTLSIHSASVFGDDNLATFSLTNSWRINDDRDRIRLLPFIGAGIGVEFDDFEVAPVVTTGVDVPINDLITGTARVNAAFDDGTDIGVVLGVGVDVLSLF